MKFKNITVISSLILAVAILVACKKKPVEQAEDHASFDKPAMLVNYADNLVLPNLTSLKTSVDSLVGCFQKFAAEKNTSNLIELRQKYIIADSRFQHAAAFEYGPAETENLRTNFNTYPVNIQQVNSNINSGNYNLGTVENIDAKGFPAIDYLLFGKNESNASIVALFETDSKGINRTGYLNACISEMQTRINTVVSGWNNGYRNTFVNSTGSQIGSSLGLMINQLNFEIDLLKNGKIGIPFGKKSLGELLPEKCEAFYANTISVKLANECLSNIEDVYLGRSASGVNGQGIDDYLLHLDARHGSGTLDEAIKSQFALAKAKLALIPEPLSTAIAAHAPLVDAAYMEIVKLLVLLKTDTPSALGIVITYQDNDGD